MITVLFFAQVRELTGAERLTLEAGFPTVEALRQALAARGDRWTLRWSRANCWRRSIKRWCRRITHWPPAMKWRFSRRSPEAEWTVP